MIILLFPEKWIMKNIFTQTAAKKKKGKKKNILILHLKLTPKELL